MMLHRQVFLVATLLLLSANAAKPAEDKIGSLPGLRFDTSFDNYAGYLSGGFDAEMENERRIFYWLTEYNGPKKASEVPVILWLNGGPGCSSMGGLFTENGPFRVNPNNQSLYENVFAWNKVGHVLYIESPPGVGFSYVKNSTLSNHLLWDDDTVADINANALNSFFTKFSDYNTSDFYVTGESYAGVYIPSLTARIAAWITGVPMPGFTNKIGSTVDYSSKFSNPMFKGIAIGNGYLNQQDLVNSLVEYQYYHGTIGEDRWEAMQESCCPRGGGGGGMICPDKCNYYKHIVSKTPGDYRSDGSTCGKHVQHAVEDALDFEIPDPYNMYQSCYKNMKKRSLFSMLSDTNAYPSDYNGEAHLNYGSTDHLGGAPCFADGSTRAYLNQKEVQKELHIDQMWMDLDVQWQDCNEWIYWNYTNIYKDTAPFFEYLSQFKANSTMGSAVRILIYNGDVDTVCNFLGDEWFAKRFAKTQKLTHDAGYPRGVWRYRGQLAGYAESLGVVDGAQLDIVTVNGAGHFVPLDRAGPALQMLANFVWNSGNYTTVDGLDLVAGNIISAAATAMPFSILLYGFITMLAVLKML